MSILPTHQRQASTTLPDPMSDLDSAVQEERAKEFVGKTPPELSFQHIVNNKALPPCSLNDFMDYLVYVAHNAEPLQFFVWYCDYVERWSQLLPRQKSLAPVWDPCKAKTTTHIRYSHKRAKSERLSKILTIMEREAKGVKDEQKQPPPERRPRRSQSISSTNFSLPRSPSSVVTSPTDPQLDWQPFTIQPCRDEMTRVVRHYITESAPRQLNLSTQDRASCIEASQQTTHPSALLPAFLVVEATLRGRLYPDFILWSTRNSNRPRTLFNRAVGVLLALLGCGLDLLLILSRQSHFLRVLCLLLWWPGFTTLVAAYRGVCVILHFRNLRQVRPWEQFGDLENDEPSSDDNPEKELTDWEPDKEKTFTTTVTAASNNTTGASSHKPIRKGSVSNSFSRVDPLRKASLATFGPRNEYRRPPSSPSPPSAVNRPEDDTNSNSSDDKQDGRPPAWAAAYARKPLWHRVFEETVPARNRSLQLLQDRVVFGAVLWGGLVASLLTVGSLFVPEGGSSR